jgi:hypothetical protein
VPGAFFIGEIMARNSGQTTENPLQNAADDWRNPVSGQVITTAGDEEEAEMTPADRVQAMLSDVSDADRAYVNLYKIEDDGTRVFCQKYSCGEVEQGGYTMFREHFGAGTYQVALYGTVPGTKRFAIRGKETVKIAAVNTALPPVVNGVNSELSQILAMIAAGQNKLLEAVTNRPPVNPMDQMKEMLTLAALMKDAFGAGPAQQKSSIAEVIDAIKEIRGVQSLIGGADEKPEPSLMEMGSQLLGVLQAAQTPQAPLIHAPQSIANARPPVSMERPPQENPMPTNEPSEREKEMFFQALRKLLAEITERAKENGDVDLAAEKLYDELPDQILNMADQPGYLELLAQFAPELTPYRPWVEKVHARLLEIIEEESQPEAPSDEYTPQHVVNGVGPTGA